MYSYMLWIYICIQFGFIYIVQIPFGCFTEHDTQAKEISLLLSERTAHVSLLFFLFIKSPGISDYINTMYFLFFFPPGSCWQSWWSSVFWLWPSWGRQCTRMSRPCLSVTLCSRAVTRPAMTRPSQSPTSATGSSRSYLCAHPAFASSPTPSTSRPSRETAVTRFFIP